MSEQTYVKDQVYSINVKELQPDPDQPRKYIDPDRLEEMSKSILQHGILQPLLFRVDKNGQKIIVAGERRYQTSMKSGLEKVPCLYTDGNAPVTALIENIIRENLTAVEEAEAIEKLRVQNDYTHEELSEVIGKARSTITQTLKINSLPEEIKNDCRNISSFPKSVLISLNDIGKGQVLQPVQEEGNNQG